MIDIHTHILPGIDDGSKSFDESIAILKKASKNGVTDIVLTPHFIIGSTYDADNLKKKQLFKELKIKVVEENIDINLYLGNEVFVENNMLELLENNYITTLNGSKYLLFEIPMNNSYHGLNDLIFNLRANDCIPIIAHPERYLVFKENPELIYKLIDQGALFQVNIGSFFGYYGTKAKELAFLLAKHHMVHFISSDTHHKENEFYDKIKDLKHELSKYISKKEINDLFSDNARKVLNNEDINIGEYTEFKKGIFGKWK